MAVNTFIPTTSSRTPTYVTPKTVVDAQGRQQTTSGYEWLDYGTFVTGAGTTRWRTNPPFASWEAGGHGMPFIKQGAGGNQSAANVKRGYIRRAQTNPADMPSTCRLYFMYNPTTITRQYVNYLDQGALDPFNTLFDSGNLVAPPSTLEFSFELFFDRQTEAMKPGNRGVLDDMDYFDLVVRNVIPGGTGANNTIPDSGVMMVNPRDITVVFSKDITVQGRPINSQIVYEKFTHEMTPTRMRIALTMRVIYMGPVRDVGTFSTETTNVDRTIPYNIPKAPEFNFTFEEMSWPSNNEDIDRPSLSVGSGVNGKDTLLGPAGTSGNLVTSGLPGERAADLAKRESDAAHTSYVGADGNRSNLWAMADCSSFVWAGLVALPDGDQIASNLGWATFAAGKRSGNIPAVASMCPSLGQNTYCERLWGYGSSHGNLDPFDVIMANCVKGDLLMRYNHPSRGDSNHVAFFWSKSNNSFSVLHAASHDIDVTITTYSSRSLQYNYGVRVFTTNNSAEHFTGSSSNAPPSNAQQDHTR
jgi:hypothetical protein